MHLWSHIIPALKDKGHKVTVVARGQESICLLLNKYGIQYIIYGEASKTRYGKVLQLPLHLLKSLRSVRKFKPDTLLGTGLIEAYIAAFLRRSCIIFEDTEPTPSLERAQWKRLVSVILTPLCFRKDLGKKQIRFHGYKELAYLHPNCFTPDRAVYDELSINRDGKYVILRFSAFEAVHDIGRHGFSLPDKYQLIKELERYASVFISTEGSLPPELGSYRLPIPFHRIHHALYYAQLLVCDTGTMAWEAAVLGTPAIAYGSFTAQFGNFIELEQKYDLLYCFRESGRAIKKALELIQQPNLKEEWAEKRQRLLKDKVDLTGFMSWFIENYPESFEIMKETPDYQNKFKQNTDVEIEAVFGARPEIPRLR